MSTINITEADLSSKKHTDAILALTNQYAGDPMGQNAPLAEAAFNRLTERLKAFPLYLGVIAWTEGKPAGLANCFYGFSTFNAARVLNIHDLMVVKEFRGRGIGKALLGFAEEKAREQNCSKITLEVREDNRAKTLYEREGFSHGQPAMYFMSKEL